MVTRMLLRMPNCTNSRPQRTLSFEVADLLWKFLHEISQMNKLYLKQGMFHRLC